MKKYKHYAVSFICYWSLLYEKRKNNHFVEASYHNLNYHFAGENWEKPILRRHFLPEAKKFELQGLSIYLKNFHKISDTLVYKKLTGE